MSVETASLSTSSIEAITATVYTSYYARLLTNCESRPELSHIGISRYWPRWIKKPAYVHWVPNLGPSRKLLRAAKQINMDFEEYGQRYLHEILSTRQGREALDWLLNLLEDGHNVVLYCYEKDLWKCHRLWLATLLDQAWGFHNGGEL